MSENFAAQPKTSDFNRPVVEEFRTNGGRVGGMFEGSDLLLLTTVGAKSGRENVTPLGYIRYADRLLVVASAGGSPRHPDWYHNLLAHPLVRVEIGTDTFEAVAVPAEEDERDRLFEHIVRQEPGFDAYQAGVQRRLPVVELERAPVSELEESTTMAGKLLGIHAWLREQLHHVRVETDAYFAAQQGRGDPGTIGLGLRIRQHCLAFCGGLHVHHAREDNSVFPSMEQQYPHLRAAIGRLREEHRTVERTRKELVTLLASAAIVDRGRFRTELDRMSMELEAHLDYEEEQLIPALSAIPFPPVPPIS